MAKKKYDAVEHRVKLISQHPSAYMAVEILERLIKAAKIKAKIWLRLDDGRTFQITTKAPTHE